MEGSKVRSNEPVNGCGGRFFRLLTCCGWCGFGGLVLGARRALVIGQRIPQLGENVKGVDLGYHLGKVGISDVIRIYRRSLSFLLITVVRELFPEAFVFVDHSLPFGGFFCEVGGRKPFTEGELAQIEDRMHEIVEADFAIRQERVALDEAIELFRQRGEMDKAKLLSRRKKDYLKLYNLRDSRRVLLGCAIPSSGTNDFRLRLNFPGDGGFGVPGARSPTADSYPSGSPEGSSCQEPLFTVRCPDAHRHPARSSASPCASP